MNYEEQEKYFSSGRRVCSLWISLVAATSLCCAWLQRHSPSRDAVFFLFIIAASLVSLAYTPDYLRLTVNLLKISKWEAMIRWRIVVAAVFVPLLIVLFTDLSLSKVWWALGTGCWLALANLLASRPSVRDFGSALRFGSDIALVATLLWFQAIGPLVVIGLLAAGAHLFRLGVSRSRTNRVIEGFLVAGIVALRPDFQSLLEWSAAVATVGFFLMATDRMVVRASSQNELNIIEALQELSRFTTYDATKVRGLWSISNQTLAYKWETAKLGENDAEKMAEWYRENSELYMFAISAYNLEYKRIRSNLAMMRYGAGKCLDYGAGNGDLILEMARRGSPAAYYDVEGTSMLFARSRADQRGLAVEFYHAKEALKGSATRKGFDTIFSFDVLEHIPDLAGELDFLASLLAPGGKTVFDVPAGATKAHPMHLNHYLNVRAHMLAKGMIEEKLGWSFRRQEKYLFRKPV